MDTFTNIFKFQAKKRYVDYIEKEYQIEWYNVIDTTITEGHNSFGPISRPKKSANKKDVIEDDFIDD